MFQPKRRRRWTIFVPMLAVLAAIPAFGGRDGSEEPAAEPIPPLVVEVQYGDTLWTIAREHCDPRRDVREVVAAIRGANDIDPARLRPGSSVAIPFLYVSPDR
jgi:Tfp pilus assembly protein FimV